MVWFGYRKLDPPDEKKLIVGRLFATQISRRNKMKTYGSLELASHTCYSTFLRIYFYCLSSVTELDKLVLLIAVPVIDYLTFQTSTQDFMCFQYFCIQ